LQAYTGMKKTAREKGKRPYTVSYDAQGKFWYCHMRGYSYIPVCGSISDQKSVAMEYAKMRNCLPNRVEEIEQQKKAEYYRDLYGDDWQNELRRINEREWKGSDET